MTDNKKNQQHFSAKEIAGLPGMPGTDRGCRDWLAREAAPFGRSRKGRGGGLEYPITCLPADTQAALAEKVLSVAPAAHPSSSPASAGASFSSARSTAVGQAAATSAPQPHDTRAASLAEVYAAKPDKIKADAAARLKIVAEFHRLQERGFERQAVIGAVTREHGISEATLARYLSLVRDEPSHLWLFLLCPAYVGRTAIADMSAEAWEVMKADYLRREKPTASACYYRVKRAAAANGWKVPSARTVLRRLREIPKHVQVLAREGKKAALQLYPYQQRSRAALHAMSIINGDGYLHNLFVLFPDGEIRRPKSWVWQDVYSSKVIGYRIDKTENTDSIRLSLDDLIRRLGIPEAVLLDNTMAAANKAMSGGTRTRFRFKVREEEPLGVFPLLGVDVRWATPGHGQAKPVERVFGIGGIGELVDKAPELSGAWTGPSTKDKPDYDGKTRAVPLAELAMVMEREVAAYNAKTGRRSPMHRGRSFDDVFAESYANATIRRATEEQRRLCLLAAEARTAKKDGSITLEAGRITRTDFAPTQANRYWHEDLGDYAGRQVVVRFDPLRMHEGVHVYTFDGRYICFAACLEAAGFNDQVKGREHSRNRRIYVRSSSEALQAVTRMDAIQAAKFLPGNDSPGAADATIPAPKVVRPEFRDALERPRAAARVASEQDRADMAQLEQDYAAPARRPLVNVLELQSDADKHAHWKTVDTRRASGEVLADQEEQFWAAWQGSDYYRLERELTEEFDRRQAAG